MIVYNVKTVEQTPKLLTYGHRYGGCLSRKYMLPHSFHSACNLTRNTSDFPDAVLNIAPYAFRRATLVFLLDHQVQVLGRWVVLWILYGAIYGSPRYGQGVPNLS